MKDASEAALLATCRLPQLGPQPVITQLLAPLNAAKEKDVRLQLGRLVRIKDRLKLKLPVYLTELRTSAHCNPITTLTIHIFIYCLE